MNNTRRSLAGHRSDEEITWVGRILGEESSLENPRIEIDTVTGWRGVHTHLLFLNVLVLIRSKELLDAHGPSNRPTTLPITARSTSRRAALHGSTGSALMAQASTLTRTQFLSTISYDCGHR
jgi:hypothetical protein